MSPYQRWAVYSLQKLQQIWSHFSEDVDQILEEISLKKSVLQMHGNVVIEAVINFSKLYEFASKFKHWPQILEEIRCMKPRGIVNIEAVINYVN